MQMDESLSQQSQEILRCQRTLQVGGCLEAC
jgi:hypothetical protein